MESNGSVQPPDETDSPEWLTSSHGHYGSTANSMLSLASRPEGNPVVSRTRAHIIVAVLCYINLLNYMDRYSLAGVLLNIQLFFQLSDSIAGLLQTIFICSFLLVAPLFGYLGDRYNRTYIMVCGLLVWMVTATGSSFVSQSQFWLLLLLRGLIGIGEASFTTIAPTVIGDLFTGQKQSIMISLFTICMPFGSGLGYIVSSSVASHTGDWRWALRVTPVLVLLGLILLLITCPDLPRGASVDQLTRPGSYWDDVKYLVKNKSYFWSTWGVTTLCFVIGALSFWMPSFLYRARVTQGLLPPCLVQPCDSTDSKIFGGVTLVTGFLGVIVSTILSRWLRPKMPNVDALICFADMAASLPCVFIVIFVAPSSIPATYVFIFIAELLLFMNWPIIADMALYVVVPRRRSSAQAFQITLCHLLGDATSPYIIGAISDAINKSKLDVTEFYGQQYSFLVLPGILVLGVLFFFITSRHLEKDRVAAQFLDEDSPPCDSTTQLPVQSNDEQKM
ncbi:protein spinster homolog 3-like isoform 2-T3 [Synchiropus picturatus]